MGRKNGEETANKRLEELFELIGKLVAGLPGPLRSKLMAQIDNLREFIMDARAPRFMIVGRRGAGKSSLINAIFNSKVAGK